MSMSSTIENAKLEIGSVRGTAHLKITNSFEDVCNDDGAVVDFRLREMKLEVDFATLAPDVEPVIIMMPDGTSLTVHVRGLRLYCVPFPDSADGGIHLFDCQPPENHPLPNNPGDDPFIRFADKVGHG